MERLVRPGLRKSRIPGLSLISAKIGLPLTSRRVQVPPKADGHSIYLTKEVEAPRRPNLDIKKPSQDMRFRGSFPTISVGAILSVLSWTVCSAQESAETDEERIETIVYSTIRPPNWDIWLYDASGEPRERLTDSPALEYNAEVSPDGRWLVFTSEIAGTADLYAIDLQEKGDPVRLTHHAAMDDAAGFSPDGERLVFVSSRDGDADIFVMPFLPDDPDAAEAGAVNLTNRPGGDFNPVFSPDGSRIAYSRQDVLWADQNELGDYRNTHTYVYVMNADGSDSELLTSRDALMGTPAWSADGAFLYYYRADNEFWEGGVGRGEDLAIRRVAVDGTSDVEFADFGLSPTLTGDGRVAFVRPPISDLDRSTLRKGRIVSVLPDGTDLRTESEPDSICLAPSFDRSSTRFACHGPGLVVGLPNIDSSQLEGGQVLLSPPDANRVVELPDRNVALQGVLGVMPALLPNGDILWSLFGGTAVGGVISAPLEATHLNGSDRRTVFDLDGETIWGAGVARDAGLIFVSVGLAMTPSAPNSIWRLSLEGNEAVQLAPDTAINEALPTATPDASVVVFRAGDDRTMRIFAMNADGGERRLLSGDRLIATMPSISPDGEWVVFTTVVAGHYKLRVERLDGSEGRWLEPNKLHIPDTSMHPRFSPDGQWIAFTSDRGFMNDEYVISIVPQPYGDLWAVPFDGGEAIRLTDDKWEDGPSDWAFAPMMLPERNY
jgi:Tol biopolymer transport system component